MHCFCKQRFLAELSVGLEASPAKKDHRHLMTVSKIFRRSIFKDRAQRGKVTLVIRQRLLPTRPVPDSHGGSRAGCAHRVVKDEIDPDSVV